RAARARPIFHHHGLTEPLAELLPDEAADEIDRGAGRERHDHADGLAGPVRVGCLRKGGARENEQQGKTHCSSRHPEVRAKRASKDDRPRTCRKLASGTTRAVALRGSALRAERLRVTVIGMSEHALHPPLRERSGRPWMARQIRSGVAGISRWATPYS